MTRDTLDFILKHILLKNFSKLFHQRSIICRVSNLFVELLRQNFFILLIALIRRYRATRNKTEQWNCILKYINPLEKLYRETIQYSVLPLLYNSRTKNRIFPRRRYDEDIYIFFFYKRRKKDHGTQSTLFRVYRISRSLNQFKRGRWRGNRRWNRSLLTQIHERHGEVDRLFPIVRDGQIRDR